MNSVNFPAKEKPPWRSWGLSERSRGFGKGTTSSIVRDAEIFEAQLRQQHAVRKKNKRVTFDNLNSGMHQLILQKQDEKEDLQKIKRRNLHMSQQLISHFRPKAISKFVPQQKNLSETHSSYRIPGKERPIPIRHSGYKTVINGLPEDYNNVSEKNAEGREEVSALDADTVTKIVDLKSKIMAGKYVSMADITSLKMKIGQAQGREFEPTPEFIPTTHRSQRKVTRRLIFCEKGIVHIPTPHTPAPESNSFGTPADLR